MAEALEELVESVHPETDYFVGCCIERRAHEEEGGLEEIVDDFGQPNLSIVRKNER